MRVMVFGATGMIGQGVLRECLAADDVERVLVIGRSATGVRHPKLREIHHEDFLDPTAIERELSGYHACFYCLGVSALGMREADYTRITYDMTLTVARAVLASNPDLVFGYVSGQGTDSSERGRLMWARVKGRTENALLALSPRAIMFRPGYIQPGPGIRSKTRTYAVMYALVRPLFPALRRLRPGWVTTTERVGRAMIEAVRHGAPARVLSTADINALAAKGGPAR